ncbi:hypothetical protein COW46_03620 [Candidatus Gracilibacteria bacterium CG17_big_fil_post_rev_8_21_14_2_50_48_13]|nr:MAG: hypothetical protein COW46_03620 [Candidatus Gracilibacteria bacterium CG17_big_fil_post_rev_8_21_14_2_50_48_13]
MFARFIAFVSRAVTPKKPKSTILGGYASHSAAQLVLWIALGLLLLVLACALLWLLMLVITQQFNIGFPH